LSNDTYFTSDEHYHHLNIIRYSNRPFRDVREMNEELIARHNSVVKPGDLVIHLGDFTMNDKYAEPIFRRLNGSHKLIPGNHDPCYRKHSRWQQHVATYRKMGFIDVLQQDEIEIKGHKVLLDHMPYVQDSRHGDKYAAYRPKDEGRILLHGHIHLLWRVRGRMINVGVDKWDYTPVHIDTLGQIVAKIASGDAQDE
jgi:calcineurin-like phosphoesterase family protein